MPERPPAGDPAPRRNFFRQALHSLLKAADEAIEGAGELPSRWKRKTARPRTVLRPPGALAEPAFVGHCERSGQCISACPIRALQPMVSSDPQFDGTPYLVPSEQACVMCDDLSCMKVCPSGALQLVDRESISIGLAGVDLSLCRRSFADPCTECIDRCPVGDRAIGLDAQGQIEVRSPGCTGCGVCEQYCPTSPRAIHIFPFTRS